MLLHQAYSLQMDVRIESTVSFACRSHLSPLAMPPSSSVVSA